MTFLEAALEILKRERRPLHFKELTEKATERKLLTFVGRTPEVTMQTQLTAAVKKAPGSPFVRVKPGVFGLLRYPEAPVEPEPAPETAAAPGKPEKSESRPAAGEARGGRRRRRGGRGRRRGRGDAPGDSVATSVALAETPSENASPSEGAEERESAETPEEPESGSLSPEARAAALAESGVLEGDGEDRTRRSRTKKDGRLATTEMRARPSSMRAPDATTRSRPSRKEPTLADTNPSPPRAKRLPGQKGMASPARHPAPARARRRRARLQAKVPRKRRFSRAARSPRPPTRPSRS